MQDKIIIEKILDGQSELYSELVNKYQLQLQAALSYNCRNRDELQHYLHEAFVKAFLKLNKFNTERSFYPWIKTIAVNLLRDDIKSRQKYQSIKEEYETVLWEKQLVSCREDKLVALQKCLSTLPDRQKDLIQQKYQNNQAMVKLAELYECKTSAVKMRLMRTREALRSCINRQLDGIND